jgi:hypothetical protein
MNKPKHEFDYNMFACTIGFLGIVVLILTMLIINN